MSYYDLRNHHPTGEGLTTDVWLARCRRACTAPAAFTEDHANGPFDSTRAPNVGRLREAPPAGDPPDLLGGQVPFGQAFFLGDYQGLTSIGPDRFRLFFPMALPGTREDPTDVFTTTLPAP